MNKLSVCIPTYNREHFIGSTIESIISEANEDVDIIISDNASNDRTEELVRKYQKIFPRIHYFRWDENVGADRNFLKVIELAESEYCWFMGSDDLVEPGALRYILSQLGIHPGISGVSVNQEIYSVDMSVKIEGVPVASGKINADRLFNDANECFSHLGLYFGYLPGQIVKRSLWNEIAKLENLHPYFNAFVHVYVIGRMLKANPSWLYIHRKCVANRSGNDSFLREVGVYGRQVIAHASFNKVVRDLFNSNSSTYKEVLSMALTGYMRGDLVNLKVHGASVGLQYKLLALYSKYYWRFPYYWLNVFPLFFIPNWFIAPLRSLFNRKKWGVRFE